MIVFAPHNVIKDAPFTRVDLVSCRNLLIYLQPPAQQKVLSLFHFALNRGGVLFLGPSESPGALLDDFETIDEHWRIYRKHSDVAHAGRPAPPAAARPSRALGRAPPPRGRRALLAVAAARHVRRAARRVHAAEPPRQRARRARPRVRRREQVPAAARRAARRSTSSTCVDAELKMVLVGGAAARAQGADADRLQGRARRGRRRATARTRSRSGRVRGRDRRRRRTCSIAFERMDERRRRAARRRAEIDVDAGLARAARRARGRAAATPRRTCRRRSRSSRPATRSCRPPTRSCSPRTRSCRARTRSCRASTRSSTRSTPSTSARSPSSPSSPTTWTTCCRAPRSARSSSTASCGSASSRRRSPRRFNLLPQDVGRPIETFAHKHRPPRAGRRPAARARQRRAPSSASCAIGTARAFFLRILPYRAKGAVDGVVLTLIDVSGLKAAEDALFHERYLLNSLLASVPDAIYFKDARGRFIRANHAMAARLGLADPREAVGQDRRSSCPITSTRSRCTSRTRRCCAPASAQHYKLEKRARARTATTAWDLVDAAAAARPRRAASSASSASSATSPSRSAPRRRSRRRCGAATSSSRCSRTSCATRSARSSPRPRCSSATADARAHAERLLDVLERQSQQMARLLDDLLEASRVTQNKIELRKRVVDLRAMVARRRGRRARPDGDARHRASRSTIDAEPLCVDGDPARLQQIQVNLLSNAAKYTPRGGHVRSSVEREGGRRGDPRRATTASGIPHGHARRRLRPVRAVAAHARPRRGRPRRRAHARALAGRDARRHGDRAQRRRGQGQRVRRAAAARRSAAERRAPAPPPRADAAAGLRRSWSSRTTPTAARCCASCSTLAGFECHAADDGLGRRWR